MGINSTKKLSEKDVQPILILVQNLQTQAVGTNSSETASQNLLQNSSDWKPQCFHSQVTADPP